MPSQMPDRATRWLRGTHIVTLGKLFTSHKQAIEYAIQPDLDSQSSKSANDRLALNTMLDNIPKHLSKPSFSDSSIGGNDAMNPYWSFNEDDDIILPMDDQSPNKDGTKGMGCVYKEMYEFNQQILWISCGVPKYNSTALFLKNAVSSDMVKISNNGNKSMGEIMGAMLVDGLVLAIALPWAPIYGVAKAANWATKASTYTSGKYYDFQSAQPVYYRTVNTILATLASSMGLYGDSRMKDNMVTVGSKQYKANGSGVPSVLRNGPDIFSIMSKRAMALGKKNGSNKKYSTDVLVEALAGKEPKGKDSWFDTFWGTVKSTALNGADYVGFRVEKSVDSSESITNSVGESSIASTINAMSTKAADARFTRRGMKTDNDFIDAAAKRATEWTKGIVNTLTLGVTETAVEVMSGNAQIDIPETWKNSSFNKSYNFTIKLRSRYGDPVSIYQSIYIPLAMLLAMGLPRSTGRSSYTSPFVVRAYCKGMFAIPLGIIESMSITRGASEFGWNHDNLPTSVTVRLSIKDLSPAMYSVAADAKLLDVVRSNSGMQEYLTTLSGVGLYERAYLFPQMRRKFDAFLLATWKNWTSPYAWGNRVGSTNLANAIASVKHIGNLPTN